jgi:hypothetical protein
VEGVEFSNLDFVAGEGLSATLGVEVLEGAHLFFFKEFCLECCILLQSLGVVIYLVLGLEGLARSFLEIPDDCFP